MAHSGASGKSFWKLLSTFLNKSRIPLIQRILNNGLSVTICKEKAQIFNDYFLHKCTTTDSGCSVQNVPEVVFNTLTNFVISDEKTLKIKRSLKPNKANGCDEISVILIKLSDSALVLPHKMIFTMCLKHGIFPKTWKFANVVSVYKIKRRT